MENEADFTGAKTGFFGRAKTGDILVIKKIVAGGGAIDKPENIKKSGFTTTRWAHNHNKFTAFNSEIEILESKRLSVAVAIALSKVFKLDNNFVFGHFNYYRLPVGFFQDKR